MYLYLKILVGVMLCIGSFYFMSQTEIYYQYCKTALETGDYLVEENQEIFMKICKDHYKDYTNHYLMNNSINIFYGFMEMSSVKLLSLNSKKYMKKRISQDVASLEFNLKLHKFTHTALYILVIYIGIVILPNLMFDFLVYLVNKILIILFVAFAIEALLNYILNYNIDMITVIKSSSDYVNLDIFVTYYRYFSNLFGFVSNHQLHNVEPRAI